MKTRMILLALFAAVGLQAAAQNAQTAWETIYPQILQTIQAPQFGDATYDIRDYGAVADDPAKLNHEAINRAIDACNRNGGGTVRVPAGVWHTGPVTLKSNVNLHLDEGATLLFTFDLSQYPTVLTRWEGMDCYNFQPMIYAYEAENIALTGKGTVDGGGTRETWWAMCGAVHYGWKEGINSQRQGRPKLMAWNEAQTPVEERVMTAEDGMRVQLINFNRCKNILIEEVTLLRSPFWVIHPLLSENITVRDVKIINDGPNGDGCDPESCKNVLIERCYFDTGDDCIAIKSGRNFDGRRWNVPSENIIVRNCRMKNGHGGVVIGSEISGGYRNLFVENCEMDSPQLDRVIRIKTNNGRGGTIENVFVRNVQVGQCKEAVLKINLLYEPREICTRNFPPIVRNVWLDNVNCAKSRYGVYLAGYDDSVNISDIHVSNSSWTGVAEDNRFVGKAADVTFENLTINNNPVTAPNL